MNHRGNSLAAAEALLSACSSIPLLVSRSFCLGDPLCYEAQAGEFIAARPMS